MIYEKNTMFQQILSVTFFVNNCRLLFDKYQKFYQNQIISRFFCEF